MSGETGSTTTGGAGPDVVARLLRTRAAGADELWLTVDGRSMWPTIRPPARVRLVAAERPRRGEVWAFVDPTTAIVVHRCARRAGPGFVFRGDGLRGADPWVPTAHVVGRVVTVVDARGTRSLGAADRVAGVGRMAQRRARARCRRAWKWVCGLMAARRDGR